MDDPKTKPLTPPSPAPKAAPKAVVKETQIPPPEASTKVVVVEEPTLRDQVASKLNIMLRSDSYRERHAIANSILDLFPE